MAINRQRQRLWLLAWPLILTNLSQPLLGLVDTALLGHLPHPRYLGAAAVGGALLALAFWGFGFLRMGTTGLVSRARGADNTRLANQITAQSLQLGLLLALILITLGPLLAEPLVRLTGASDQVAPEAVSYLQIRLWAAPATLSTYVLVGWFIAYQDTRSPLVAAVLTQLVNIGADVVFIVLLDWRSDGAALASVLGEYAGCCLLYWRLRRINPHLRWRVGPQAQVWRQLLSVNADLLVRTWCLLFTFLFFTSQGAQQGDTLLAANAILLQWIHLVSYSLDGLAHATESLTGEAAGGRDPQRRWQTLRWAAIDSAWVALTFSALLWWWQLPIVALLTELAPVQTAVLQHLHWALLLPVLSVAAYVLDGYAIGAGRTRAMRDTLLVSLFGVFLPVWYATQGLGNHGLWLALLAFNLSRGVGLGLLCLPELRYQLRKI